MLEVPLASTRIVFPKGAPPSTSDFLFLSIHFIQASMPVFICSGVDSFIIFSKSAAEAMYKTMNFFIGSFAWVGIVRSGCDRQAKPPSIPIRNRRGPASQPIGAKSGPIPFSPRCPALLWLPQSRKAVLADLRAAYGGSDARSQPLGRHISDGRGV